MFGQRLDVGVTNGTIENDTHAVCKKRVVSRANLTSRRRRMADVLCRGLHKLVSILVYYHWYEGIRAKRGYWATWFFPRSIARLRLLLWEVSWLISANLPRSFWVGGAEWPVFYAIAITGQWESPHRSQLMTSHLVVPPAGGGRPMILGRGDAERCVV